jgi:hypothetical protein
MGGGGFYRRILGEGRRVPRGGSGEIFQGWIQRWFVFVDYIVGSRKIINYYYFVGKIINYWYLCWEIILSPIKNIKKISFFFVFFPPVSLFSSSIVKFLEKKIKRQICLLGQEWMGVKDGSGRWVFF